jgi:hypothetical protein
MAPPKHAKGPTARTMSRIDRIKRHEDVAEHVGEGLRMSSLRRMQPVSVDRSTAADRDISDEKEYTSRRNS